MAKLPNPPKTLKLRPAVKTLRAGTLVFRVHFRGGRRPAAWNAFRFFGPTKSRFDHQLPPVGYDSRRGILYGAKCGPTCLAEVFQDTRCIDRSARDPWLAGFRLERDVALLNLTGAWPTRAGASMNICSGRRSRARLWSRAIYDAYAKVEGLWYCSAMDANRPAIALYERARTAFPATPELHRALADPALTTVIKRAASRFGYAVV